MCSRDIDQLLRCSSTQRIHQRSRHLIRMSTGGTDCIPVLRRSFYIHIDRRHMTNCANRPRCICTARVWGACTCNRSGYLGWRLLRIPARKPRNIRQWCDERNSILKHDARHNAFDKKSTLYSSA